MEFIYGTCATCGTQTLTDPETEAEVHFDIRYKNCGVEGELQPLLEWAESGAGRPAAKPNLRVVK